MDRTGELGGLLPTDRCPVGVGHRVAESGDLGSSERLEGVPRKFE